MIQADYFLKDREPQMLNDYNRLVENPEWKKMRGMAVPPKETILPDGTVMRGNRIERNIFYYPSQPKSGTSAFPTAISKPMCSITTPSGTVAKNRSAPV